MSENVSPIFDEDLKISLIREIADADSLRLKRLTDQVLRFEELSSNDFDSTHIAISLRLLSEREWGVSIEYYIKTLINALEGNDQDINITTTRKVKRPKRGHNERMNDARLKLDVARHVERLLNENWNKEAAIHNALEVFTGVPGKNQNAKLAWVETNHRGVKKRAATLRECREKYFY